MLEKSLFSWLMLPVYLWQGVRLRMGIERLRPTDLPVAGRIEGRGETIKLLVMGDSTVASVGVEELEGTFAFCMASAINQRSGQPVVWRAAGANSASSGDLRDYVLPHIAETDVTHILLSVGTNDMKNFHLISRFKREFGTLLYALRTRFPQAKIVWTQIPDMRKFPVLPDGLGRVLAARAALINQNGKQLCAERGAVAADAFPIVDASGFGRDGFHPNDKGYRAWATFLATYFVGADSAVGGAKAPSESDRVARQKQGRLSLSS